MSYKTSGGGYFLIPAGPSAGTIVAKAAAADTYGNWVELVASTSAALFIVGVNIEDVQNPNAWIQVDIGVGAAASEASVGEVKRGEMLSSGANHPLMLPYPIPVAASARIACRTAGSTAGGDSIPLSLICINQADLAAIDSSGAPTAAAIADAVWDEAQADHVAAGSFGLVASEVADILVDTGTTLQGELDGIQADTEDIQARLPAALVGGRIDATVDATGMEAGAVDAILDEVIEGTYTFRQFLRLLAAALGGKLSGAATTTIVMRDASDTKTRISATVDADGNRSAVTLDLT